MSILLVDILQLEPLYSVPLHDDFHGLDEIWFQLAVDDEEDLLVGIETLELRAELGHGGAECVEVGLCRSIEYILSYLLPVPRIVGAGAL